MIRTVVVERDPSLRLLTTLNLEADVPGCTVVGAAGDGATGLSLIRATAPDIAVVDLDGPASGALIADVRELGMPVQVVAYSDDAGLLQESLRAGADAVVLQDGDIDALGRAVATLTGRG